MVSKSGTTVDRAGGLAARWGPGLVEPVFLHEQQEREHVAHAWVMEMIHDRTASGSRSIASSGDVERVHELACLVGERGADGVSGRGRGELAAEELEFLGPRGGRRSRRTTPEMARSSAAARSWTAECWRMSSVARWSPKHLGAHDRVAEAGRPRRRARARRRAGRAGWQAGRRADRRSGRTRRARRALHLDEQDAPGVRSGAGRGARRSSSQWSCRVRCARDLGRRVWRRRVRHAQGVAEPLELGVPELACGGAEALERVTRDGVR